MLSIELTLFNKDLRGISSLYDTILDVGMERAPKWVLMERV